MPIAIVRRCTEETQLRGSPQVCEQACPNGTPRNKRVQAGPPEGMRRGRRVQDQCQPSGTRQLSDTPASACLAPAADDTNGGRCERGGESNCGVDGGLWKCREGEGCEVE